MGSELRTKTSEGACAEAGDDTLCSMIRQFYSRPMISTIILVWFWALVFIAGAVYCGVHFFQTDETRLQIAYAAGFVCFVYMAGLMKVFAWQLIHRNNIKRAIGRLQVRLEECLRACQGKP
jgi:membrane-associated phospholipid phosphatase